MISINQTILVALENANNKLSQDARDQIKSFLASQIHPYGGFVDRAGNADPYYSVFGYSLAYFSDIKIDTELHSLFLKDYQNKNTPDFIHAVSLLRCHYLLKALAYKNQYGNLAKTAVKSAFLRRQFEKKIATQIVKEHADLLEIINTYKSADNGYNHLKKNSKTATVYANFLVWGLLMDLFVNQQELNDIIGSNRPLQQENGSFVNILQSKSGITTATAAGVIMLLDNRSFISKSINWLKEQSNEHGGFLAGEDLPIADVLSSASAMLALVMAKENIHQFSKKYSEFINLHWDGSGGFFGSIADQIPDVEYTYYGLLGLGLVG